MRKLLKKLAQRIRRRDRATLGYKRQSRKHRRTGKRGYKRQAGRWGRRAKREAKAARFIRFVIHKRKRAAKQMSPHFHASEFDCHDGTPVPEQSYEALRHLCKTYLEPLRARFGSVRITSGHRHEVYNRSIGGASESMHIYDLPERNYGVCASDVECERGTPQEWAAFLETLNPGGLCAYPASNFVHVDNRHRIGLPAARWSA